MIKSLIAAMTPSGVIGNCGKLPWPRLPGDLPRFRRLTMGKPCIMGRKTYQSLSKPLDGRPNIIVSRSGISQSDDYHTTSTVLEAWIKAAEFETAEAFVIGGAEVYSHAINSCDRLYLTILQQEFAGNTRLANIDLREWTIVDREYVDCAIPYQNLILHKHTMTQFITLERLPLNQLPLPRYGTIHSAGLDFAACLTRPCKIVESGSGDKTDFWAIPCDNKPNVIKVDRIGWDPKVDQTQELALTIYPNETIMVPLGFKSAFDHTCVLKFYPRSSIGLKGLVLANGTAIIDSDYRGELFVALVNRTTTKITIKHGERIVQGILVNFSQGIVKEGAVNDTIRGEGGFGSTGQFSMPPVICPQTELIPGITPVEAEPTIQADQG